MPFALIVIGLVMIVAAVRDTTDQLTSLIKGDFSGPNNFGIWVVTILLIGVIGYVDTLKPLSRVFLALVIVVLFLRKGTGFFNQFQAQIFGLPNSSAAISL